MANRDLKTLLKQYSKNSTHVLKSHATYSIHLIIH